MPLVVRRLGGRLAQLSAVREFAPNIGVHRRNTRRAGSDQDACSRQPSMQHAHVSLRLSSPPSLTHTYPPLPPSSIFLTDSPSQRRARTRLRCGPASRGPKPSEAPRYTAANTTPPRISKGRGWRLWERATAARRFWRRFRRRASRLRLCGRHWSSRRSCRWGFRGRRYLTRVRHERRVPAPVT